MFFFSQLSRVWGEEASSFFWKGGGGRGCYEFFQKFKIHFVYFVPWYMIFLSYKPLSPTIQKYHFPCLITPHLRMMIILESDAGILGKKKSEFSYQESNLGELGFLFSEYACVTFQNNHHSHSFTRLEIYHHISFIYHTFDIQILAVCRMFVP